MMNKYAFLVLVLLITEYTAFSQVKFEVKYTPDYVYTTETKIDSKGFVDFKASPDIIIALKRGGYTLPLKIDTSVAHILETKTASIVGKDIPFIQYFTSFENIQRTNNKEFKRDNPFENMIISGQYIDGKVYKFQKIEGDKISDASKDLLKKTIEQAVEHLVFPSHALQIGDSFDQEVPLEMPIPVIGKLLFNIKTTYTLKRIEGKNAFFDTTTLIIMKNNSMDTNFKTSGNGKGVLVFDSTVHMITRIKNSLNINVTLLVNAIEVSLKFDTVTDVIMKAEKQYEEDVVVVE